MKIKTIEKKDIKGLLKRLALDWDVCVPQKHMGGDVWFDSLSHRDLDAALDNVVLETVDTVLSPKEIFFPQLESMLKFKDGNIKETKEKSLPKLIFGIRPCDLKGLLFSDEFFKRNFEDKYYLSRLKDRFIVVIGCIQPPRPTCFCVTAKTGPFAESGFDLQLVDAGDFYFVETGSKKGEDFISQHKKFFKNASQEDTRRIGEIKARACDAVELRPDFQKALEMMKSDDFVPEENYTRIGERCIYCGACLYTCPTCTCFNVFDNAKDNQGERLRNWDTCVFEGYTRETSGHNPRKEKWQRTLRRYEHKLKYDYKMTGMSGCIACGRCLSSCPVDIGISKFIQEITEKRKLM